MYALRTCIVEQLSSSASCKVVQYIPTENCILLTRQIFLSENDSLSVSGHLYVIQQEPSSFAASKVTSDRNL